MASLSSALLDLGRLDTLSYKDTFVHRLNPGAKLIVTIAFIGVVLSFPKYEFTGLVPFFIFPMVLISLADLPVGFLLRNLLIISPFAVLIGIFNPVLDRQVALYLGPLSISWGWVSFGSIMARYYLTAGAALILIATTSFPGVCAALERFRVPRLFVVQLMLLYRYILVLAEEGLRMVRARDMRSFGGRGPDLRLFVQMLGVLFLRSLDRAERVYQAMGSRGFDGEIRTLKRLGFGPQDLLFVAVSGLLMAIFRVHNLSEILGALTFRFLK